MASGSGSGPFGRAEHRGRSALGNDGGLASCRAANFPWWQDDHNYYIDLRISLPMRWACQEIARRVGAGHPDDTLYLFWEEIMDVSAGRRPYAKLAALVEERKQYFDY